MENENGNVKSENSSKSTINDSSTDQDIVNKSDPLKEDVTTSPRETMVKNFKIFTKNTLQVALVGVMGSCNVY